VNRQELVAEERTFDFCRFRLSRPPGTHSRANQLRREDLTLAEPGVEHGVV
jgi:hypothetical protein